MLLMLNSVRQLRLAKVVGKAGFFNRSGQKNPLPALRFRKTGGRENLKPGT